MTEKIFRETQRFNQVWVWILIVPSALLLIFFALFGIYKQIILGILFGNNPASDPLLIIISTTMFISGAGLLLFFYIARLETKISKDRIEIRFKPIIKRRAYSWENIQKAYVRKYKPLLEYGGWGIRYGLKGKAYNTGGNYGLQLEFKDHKKLLIGTQKPLELEKFLNEDIFNISEKESY